MKDKYYTPEIEEFHVGFEYERCDDGYKWFLDVYPRAAEHIKLENFLSYTRVKYLDSDDIESLGFKQIDPHPFYTLNRSETHWLAIQTLHDDKCLIGLIDKSKPTDWNPLFVGIIKNKSELKRTLKQIGYESK